MSKHIQITKGLRALVDDEDAERVARLKWSAHSAGYAVARDPDSGHLVLLHRYVLCLKRGDGVVVDHKNHDKLDCRRANLLVCSQSQNMMNRRTNRRSGFSSEFRGVHHRSGKSRSGTRINARGYTCVMEKPWFASYRGRYVGVFKTEEEAAYCRDLVALREEGMSAQLNFPISRRA